MVYGLHGLCGPVFMVYGLHGLCGRKATLNYRISELRSCVKVEVAGLGSPSLIVVCVCSAKVIAKRKS